MSILSMTLAGGLLMTSCSPGAAPTDKSMAQGGPIAQGGEVTQIVSMDPSTFDPARLGNNNPNLLASYFNLVYGQLLIRDFKTGGVSGSIANSMEPNEDGTVWTLTLNEGVMFTDGTPLNAEAVKVNWDRLADPKVAAFVGDFARSLTTKVIDELTLEIRVEQPNFFLDRQVAAQLNFIVSPTALKSNPDVFTTDPVGAGPFDLAQSVAGSHHVFEKNEDYFQDGKPILDSVTLKVLTDRQQQIDTLLAGGSDAAIAGSWDVAGMLKGRLTIPDLQVGGGRLMVFNTASGPFEDPRARKALSLAVSGGEVAKIQDLGAGSDGASSLFSEASPYYDEKRTLPRSDPAEAQRLLDELASEGKALDFTFTVAGAGGTRVAEYLQSKLKQFDNVTVRINSIPVQSLEERVVVRDDFDVSIRPGIYYVKSPAPDLTAIFRTDGPQNWANYSSEEMDAALAKLEASKDEAAVDAALDEVHEQYLEDMPYWAFGNSVAGMVHNPKLQNVESFEEGAILWQNAGIGE